CKNLKIPLVNFVSEHKYPINKNMGAAESSHWPTKLNGVEEIMLSAIVKSVAILIPTIDTSARLTPIGTRKKISPMATTTPVTPITSCGSISLSQIVKQKAASTQRSKGIENQLAKKTLLARHKM